MKNNTDTKDVVAIVAMIIIITIGISYLKAHGYF